MTRIIVCQVQEAVAADYNVPVRALSSDRQHHDIVVPRHVAMALSCELTPATASAIGRAFGGRDHSTISYARDKMARLREADSSLDGRMQRIARRLTGPVETRPEVQLDFLLGPLFDFVTHEPLTRAA